MSLDAEILLWIQETLRCEPLSTLMIAVTRLGDYGAVWIALGLILCAFRKTRPAGFTVLLALALQALIGQSLFKPLIGRPRPFHTVEGLHNLVTIGGYSFPSGHTGSSFAAASAVRRMLSGRAGIIAIVVAALIGCSRLYVGVHYPTDVLGGIILGWLCGIASAALVGKVQAAWTGKH
ncbi:MAG: phosphatase PAP2 family protein [Butyricicoccaceae bacterium]